MLPLSLTLNVNPEPVNGYLIVKMYYFNAAGLCNHFFCPPPETLTLTLQKPEGFRAPDDGITTSLRQGVKGEVVVVYLESLTTQDLKYSGFPAG